MGKVLKFPFDKTQQTTGQRLSDQFKHLEQQLPPPPLTEQQVQMEKVLRLLVTALRRGTIQPERLFLVFEQSDTFSYLNLGFPPDELPRAVDLVLQDIARGYDSD